MSPANPILAAQRAFVPSAARTATGTSEAIDVEDWDIVTAEVNVSAVSGTTPQLLVRIQTSYDGGTTWTDIAVGNAQITAAGRSVISTATPGAINATSLFAFDATDGTMSPAVISKAVALGTHIRFQWTISGTNPSFTFQVYGIFRRLG